MKNKSRSTKEITCIHLFTLIIIDYLCIMNFFCRDFQDMQENSPV